MNIFGEFTKVEKQDDGTIIVKGIASTETKDAQGEIVKADAMRAALPEYMQFGAVREMHKASAAGTAISAHVDDKGNTILEALIVDPVAVQKVEKGVYKGFSIGGSYTGRDKMDKSIVTGVKLTEISLVDRPANPECVISLYKADSVEPDGAEPAPAAATPEPDPAAEAIQKAAVDELAGLLNKGDVSPLKVLDLVKREFSAGERKKDAKSGEAMPGGSFPIENGADLENAITAVGRAKDPEAAKKHIMARAKALGMTDKLPDSWTGDGGKAGKAEAGADLKKWLGEEAMDASRAIDALNILYQLYAKESSEPEDEGTQTADIAAAILRIKNFVAAEIQEPDDPASAGTAMALADKIGALAKAGARNSAADKGRLEAIHKAVVDLGYECPGAAKAALPEGLAKLAGEDVSTATLTTVLTKLAADNADMAQRLAKLEDAPAKPKGILRMVTKGDDVLPKHDDEAAEPDLTKMSPDERAAYEMRKALANPQMMKM